MGYSSNQDVFVTPKPVSLISRVSLIGSQPHSTILDFFAGSGTTLHAVMQLNAEDGGQRQCILVTNNENNICEEVTYERNRRVIQGYTNSKGATVPGLRYNNLRYYRSSFVDRSPSLANKKALTRLATELLCIKENCYTECTRAVTGRDLPWYRLFSNGACQYLSITYDDACIEETVELITALIDRENPAQPVKVYVFSNGAYAYSEEFEDLLDRVTLCALPDAIYKAYQQVLPRRQTPQVGIEDPETSSGQPTLFDQAHD
jgi:adenine-specific DNA-methyltransferase